MDRRYQFIITLARYLTYPSPQIRLDHQISNSASVFGRISCPTLVHMQESGMELHVSEEVGMDESEEQELAIRNIELLND